MWPVWCSGQDTPGPIFSKKCEIISEDLLMPSSTGLCPHLAVGGGRVPDVGSVGVAVAAGTVHLGPGIWNWLDLGEGFL